MHERADPQDAEAALASYVIATVGEDLALAVFRALGEPDLGHRAGATAGLFWAHDQSTWPGIEAVLRLNATEVTRRAAVIGLARRFGLPVPRLIESDLEWRHRRIRDHLFSR